MFEIYLDQSLVGKNLSTSRVYSDGTLSVDSGCQVLEPLIPAIVFSFNDPTATVIGGPSAKAGWDQAKVSGSHVDYAWGLLLKSMTKEHMASAIAEAQQVGRSGGLNDWGSLISASARQLGIKIGS